VLAALLLSLPVVLAGILLDSSRLVAAGTVVLGILAVAKDLRHGIRGVTPATVFAMFSGVLTGVANVTGLSSPNTDHEDVFFLYVDEAFLLTASTISYVGTVFTLLGMAWVLEFEFSKVLPVINGSFSQSALSRVIPIAAVTILLSTGPIRGLGIGAIGALLGFFPTFAVFLLSFSGWRNHKSLQVWVALALAAVVAAHALFFAYLRSAVVIPMFAFALGAVLGARSARPLRSRFMLPVYGAGGAFVVVFKAFGELRSSMGAGMDRIDTLRAADSGNAWESVLAFVSRLSSFNQLSQVAHLVDRDGLYRGATLEYLGYAFIPRVLWPEKPIIAKGQWFAFEIGRAQELDSGLYSNSINMTVPGELYLNFGWIGVMTGCLLVGAYFMLLWRATSFWETDDNHLGQALGFYLLFTALSLGADLQVLVTLTAIYLLFVLASFLLNRSTRRALPGRA
jgi:hypothetical protein